MRFAIFSSWGIALAAAVAGSVMNTQSFYVVRFGAPVLGSILMLWLGTFHPWRAARGPAGHRDQRRDPRVAVARVPR